MKKNKIKYIFKNLLLIILMAILAIFLYVFFTNINEENKKEENYGTKLSAQTEDNNEENNITNKIEKVSKCVVGVSKIKNAGSSAFLVNSSNELGLGTGIIVSKNGYILTNQHVAGNINSKVYITTEEGNTFTGKVIWENSDIDLAFIKVEEIFEDYIEILKNNTNKVGEKVYAIGNPIGYEFQRSVTSGIISAVNRTVKVKNEDESYSYMTNLIQTDATINPGNSGGPLINEQGELIGITTIKITSAEGIGFAIPIDIVQPIVEKLNKENIFKEAYLGIFAYDGDLIAYLNQNIKISQGIYIESILKDGPAANSQLKKGDIIVKIDNTNINKMSDLQKYIFSKNPEDEIILGIIRGNKEIEIKIILGEKY